VKPFALGVIADLRGQRLLPIAILLVAALVAVPVLLRKAPEPAPPAAAIPAVETTPDGLPAPDAALASDPLVTMASLESSSDLDSFDSRDPFKPLQSMSDVAADADDGASGAAGAPLADDASSDDAASVDSAGFDGSGETGGGEIPNLTAPGDVESTTPDEEPTPEPAPQPEPEPEPTTYAVDVSFAGPEQARQVRGLPRLAMLPHASVPLLIFLGVSDGGEATFLIDSKLRPDAGEGECRPSFERCATVGLEPGERQTFVDDEGRSYVLQLDQIRSVSVDQAIRRRQATDAQAARSESAPQVFLPVLVDIFDS
jgi:hypothetical protein